jgi:hypothetical protein
MPFPRLRLISIAALTTYLVVNIGAGALHHHHQGTAGQPGMSPAARDSTLQIQAAAPAGDDDEETCPLCHVLHLARTLSKKVHPGLPIVPTGSTLSAAAIIQPHPFKATTRARSPPVA